MSDYVGIEVDGMGFDGHLTLAYLGENITPDQGLYVVEKLRDEYSDWDSLTTVVSRGDFAMFGGSNDIPVILVNNTEKLEEIREFLFSDPNIDQSSGYPWNPHITLKPVDGIPLVIQPEIHLSDIYVKYENRRWYI